MYNPTAKNTAPALIHTRMDLTILHALYASGVNCPISLPAFSESSWLRHEAFK